MNAADYYRAAFEIASGESFDEVFDASEPGTEPEVIAGIVARHQDVLTLLARAVEAPIVDWGIDLYRTGMQTEWRHAGRMRRLYLLNQLAIVHAIHEGRIEQALANVRIAMRMAEHTAGTERSTVAITSLMALSIRNDLQRTLASKLSRMTAEERSRLAGILVPHNSAGEIDRMLDCERIVSHDYVFRLFDQSPVGLRLSNDDAVEVAEVDSEGQEVDEFKRRGFLGDPESHLREARLTAIRLEQLRVLTSQPLKEAAEPMRRLRDVAIEDGQSSAFVIPQLVHTIFAHHLALTQRRMLLAAIALLDEDEEAFARIPDPIDEEPFEIIRLDDGGFRLVSRFRWYGDRQVEMDFPAVGR
ncbi:MAG: hypothetical protein JJU36_12835 [Phycisphaeraceae bacterium]|nr:hypothetical protein [Phycisphaeraceae bacterium]